MDCSRRRPRNELRLEPQLRADRLAARAAPCCSRQGRRAPLLEGGGPRQFYGRRWRALGAARASAPSSERRRSTSNARAGRSGPRATGRRCAVTSWSAPARRDWSRAARARPSGQRRRDARARDQPTAQRGRATRDHLCARAVASRGSAPRRAATEGSLGMLRGAGRCPCPAAAHREAISTPALCAGPHWGHRRGSREGAPADRGIRLRPGGPPGRPAHRRRARRPTTPSGAIEYYLLDRYAYDEQPAASRRLPLRALPVQGPSRLLPAVLGRDGADAAARRDPGPRRRRVRAGVADRGCGRYRVARPRRPLLGRGLLQRDRLGPLRSRRRPPRRLRPSRPTVSGAAAGGRGPRPAARTGSGQRPGGIGRLAGSRAAEELGLQVVDGPGRARRDRAAGAGRGRADADAPPPQGGRPGRAGGGAPARRDAARWQAGGAPAPRCRCSRKCFAGVPAHARRTTRACCASTGTARVSGHCPAAPSAAPCGARSRARRARWVASGSGERCFFRLR